MINARQQTEAIDDKDVGRGERFFCSRFFYSGIANDLPAIKQFFNLLKMILTNHMRGNDQFPVAVLVEILDENLLIRWPR